MVRIIKLYFILLLEIIVYFFTELKGIDIDYIVCYRINMVCLIISTTIFFNYIFRKKEDIFLSLIHI